MSKLPCPEAWLDQLPQKELQRVWRPLRDRADQIRPQLLSVAVTGADVITALAK